MENYRKLFHTRHFCGDAEGFRSHDFSAVRSYFSNIPVITLAVAHQKAENFSYFSLDSPFLNSLVAESRSVNSLLRV